VSEPDAGRPPPGGVLAVLLAVNSMLPRLGWRYALVGGLAVSARVEPRFTRDVDLVVSTSGDSESESVVQALRSEGWELFQVLEHQPSGRLATARFRAPARVAPGIVLDLLFASSGIERELVSDAENFSVSESLSLPVIRIGHLLALKLLSRDDIRRPQDIADIRALLSVADEAERRRAEEALDLIQARGFARGRDLRAAFAGLLAAPESPTRQD